MAIELLKLSGINCKEITTNNNKDSLEKQLSNFDAITLTCKLNNIDHRMLIFKDIDGKYWLYTTGTQYKIKDDFYKNELKNYKEEKFIENIKHEVIDIKKIIKDNYNAKLVKIERGYKF